MSKTDKVPTDFVRIYEDWVEIEGTVFYRWRAEGEKEWHYKKTPYTEKPVVNFRLMTQEEFEWLTQAKDQHIQDYDDLPLHKDTP